MKYSKNHKRKNFLFLIILFLLLIGYFFSYDFLKYNTSKISIYLYYPINYLTKKIEGFKSKEMLALENEQLLLMNKNANILKQQNQILEEEIIFLKEQLNLKNIYTNYKIINATVISRNKLYWFNELLIDKGKDDNIKTNMAVVTNKGLIGKIIEVNKNTSIVKLITNNDKNNKISVKVPLPTGYLHGIITDYETGLIKVTGITNYDNVSLNSKVVTSGFGTFPDGLEVGYIKKIENDNLNISKILYVLPNQDMNNIKYVSVLGNNIND